MLLIVALLEIENTQKFILLRKCQKNFTSNITIQANGIWKL